MASKHLSRRNFITTSTAGITVAALSNSVVSLTSCSSDKDKIKYSGYPADTPEGFSFLTEKYLPEQKLYDYHKKLTTEPVHIPRRDVKEVPGAEEMSIADQGWKLIYNAGDSDIIKTAVLDFQDYLTVSQNVNIQVEELSDLKEFKTFRNTIVAGTRKQLEGYGLSLKSPKSYEIDVSSDRIIVCGYDERGVMFGLYNLEARMNLREAPFLPASLHTIRQSLYNTRMALSWMGWMEWPDRLLSHMAHDGFDGIFASVYANPNGDRTTAETSTDFYARLMFRVRQQDPKRIRDLIDRAAKYGIKVYTPVIYQYMGTRESEMGLRKLVRDIIHEFPDIKGYILLTEGFWYKAWRDRGGTTIEGRQDWARNWCKAVGIVSEECHKIDPDIEILPWEYNIPNRPENVDLKRYFIQHLPSDTTPMPTWENGKSFEMGDMKGHLTDYSLNQIGPAEVSEAQIIEAKKRGMKVYSKVDTFASWQYGTIPYLPCPYQWYERYMALEKHGVNGTLESWSSGYKPNFMSEIRAWTCWTDLPDRDTLFSAMASRIFGKENTELVLKAWDHFSRAIRFIPDTGAHMGTNNAVGNPLFFIEPPARTLTYNYSWGDPSQRLNANPYWPFTVSRMVFYPDFSNRTNLAESYAKSRSGVQVSGGTKVLPIFLDYMNKAIDQMEEGLKYYRTAASHTIESKRQSAILEVIVAEQMHRMMQSAYAILKFEDLRFDWVKEKDGQKRDNLLDKMEEILKDEIARTKLSLVAASHDSRLGFQFEQDYVYTPYSLTEKIKLMEETLNIHFPEARKKKKE